MRIETAAFAAAFTLGIFGAGLATNAEDPPEVPKADEIPVRKLAVGTMIRTGAPGIVGTPGTAKLDTCEVTARIDGEEIIVEVKRTAKDGELPALELVALKVQGGGDEMSRMGPMLIEAFKHTIEAREGTTKISIDIAQLAGAEVMIRTPAVEVVKGQKSRRPQRGGYVLHIPEEAAKS